MKVDSPPKYNKPCTLSITIDNDLRSIPTSCVNKNSKTMPFSYLCLRCNKRWHPRITSLPKGCPKCRSLRWNIPYQRYQWSKEETETVKELYDGTKLSIVKISRKLDMPFERVRQKLSSLKILVWTRTGFWTKEDDAYMMDNYGYVDGNTMAEYLGRSHKAIEIRASRLHIRGNRQGYNALSMSKIVGLSTPTICRYLQVGIIKGIRFPLYSGNTLHEWQISKLNIIHFLEKHFLLYAPLKVKMDWQAYIPFEERNKWISVGDASREFNLSMQWFYERVWSRAMLARKGIGRKHHGLIAYVYRPDIEETLNLGGQYLPKYATPDIPYQKGSMRGKLVPHIYKYVCPTCGNRSDVGEMLCPKCQLDKLKLISRSGSANLLLKDTSKDNRIKKLAYERTKRLVEQHPCIDCGRPCNKNSSRCRPCHIKYRRQIHKEFNTYPHSSIGTRAGGYEPSG